MKNHSLKALTIAFGASVLCGPSFGAEQKGVAKPPAAPIANEHPQPPAVEQRPKPTLPPPGKGPSIGINPRTQVDPKRPTQVEEHKAPSHLENKFSQENYSKAEKNVEEVRAKNQNLRTHLASHSEAYQKNFYPKYEQMSHFGAYHGTPAYSHYYGAYHSRGFYGGYYYPIRPFLNFGSYFYYPVAYWLYNSSAAPSYYQAYYNKDVAPFQYAGVVYPTDTIRDLSADISGLEPAEQAAFREDMTTLVGTLIERISKVAGRQVTLDAGEIAITHYVNLKNEAIEMDGFVDKNSQNIHVPFEALLDLEKAKNTLVFVPSALLKEDDASRAPEPTEEDVKALAEINGRIKDLGGDPLVAHAEPQ